MNEKTPNAETATNSMPLKNIKTVRAPWRRTEVMH
jgi:hypothetical protein